MRVRFAQVMTYARTDKGINWDSPSLGQKMVPAKWLMSTKREDPVLDAALKLLTPLVTLNLTDVRVGGKLLARHHVTLELSLAAVHSENHQLRMQVGHGSNEAKTGP
jgi:hypothetical protein